MPPSAPVAGTWSAARPPPTERLPGSAQRDRTGLGSGRRPIFRPAQATGRSFSAPMALRIASCDSVGRVAHSRIDFPSPNRTHGPPRRNPAPDPASSAGYFPRTSSGPAIHRPSSAFGEHGPRAPISFIDSTGGEERAAVVDEVEGEAVPKLGYHRLGPSEELRTWIVTSGLGGDQLWGAWTWAPYLGEREVDRGTRRLVGSTRTASLTGGDAIPRTGAILFAKVGVRLLRGGVPLVTGGPSSPPTTGSPRQVYRWRGHPSSRQVSHRLARMPVEGLPRWLGIRTKVRKRRESGFARREGARSSLIRKNGGPPGPPATPLGHGPPPS